MDLNPRANASTNQAAMLRAMRREGSIAVIVHPTAMRRRPVEIPLSTLVARMVRMSESDRERW
jgi:hypothetical protein